MFFVFEALERELFGVDFFLIFGLIFRVKLWRIFIVVMLVLVVFVKILSVIMVLIFKEKKRRRLLDMCIYVVKIIMYL